MLTFSNYLTHLSRSHKNEYEAFDANAKVANTHRKTETTITNYVERTIKMTPGRQAFVTKLLTAIFTEDGLPLHTLSKKGFRNFIKVIFKRENKQN